jgi:hypothetical protein
MPSQHISKPNLLSQLIGSQLLCGLVCKYNGQAFNKMLILFKSDLLLLIQKVEERNVFVALGIGTSHSDKKKKLQKSKSCKSYSTFSTFHLKLPFLIRHTNMSYSQIICHLLKNHADLT